MTKFTEVYKLYTFKNKNRANLSLRVNDDFVIEYQLTIDQLSDILNNWQQGIEITTKHNHWLIEYKEYSPRPIRDYSPYVRVSVNHQGVKFHYRLTTSQMQQLEHDFDYQLSNTMHWDQ